MPRLYFSIKSDSPFLDIPDISITETTAILGHSGAGKTTVLRCLAGLHTFQGEVLWNGQKVDARVLGQKRGFSFAWQDSRLLPNLTVRKNIEISGGFDDFLCDLFGIVPLLDHYPHQLSGGESQRVNIVRALSSPVPVVLLDEPMQGLDHVLITQTLEKMLFYAQQKEKLLLYVTHDLDQVFRGFRQALVLEHGRVLGFSSLKNLYEIPDNAKIAQFFGDYGFLDPRDFPIYEKPRFVRPEWLGIHFKGDYNAVIESISYQGGFSVFQVKMRKSGKKLPVKRFLPNSLAIGDKVHVYVEKSVEVQWCDADVLRSDGSISAQ